MCLPWVCVTPHPGFTPFSLPTGLLSQLLQPLMGNDHSPPPLFSTKLGLGPQEEEAEGQQILQVGQSLGSGQGPALHTWLRCDRATGRKWDIPIPMDQGWESTWIMVREILGMTWTTLRATGSNWEQLGMTGACCS